MCLVKNNYFVSFQKGVRHCFSQKHTICEILQNCSGATAILKSDAVTNLFSNIHVHFLSHTPGNRHRSHSPRLSARNHHLPTFIRAFNIHSFQHKLRNLFHKNIKQKTIRNVPH
ncbi:hypothetical protein VIGAN_08194700 [Vigna angularis var. angularis]|uniref:Uncharacterized protein n=1 Tax=Vigna angularis var. angularis TaxID=157739 RepID=A0A0S3SR31_PHAAN|nr:hypothetical protein VIGAN_08194700 [Vigna angularis var. angularis]